jgi:hypothetical protein
VGELSVEAKTLRPGRRVSLREATLSDEEGRPVMLCRAWRISAFPTPLPDNLEPERRTLLGPREGEEKPFFEMAPAVGYHRAMEARFVEGSWREPGAAAAWLRMQAPLLPGEEPSPLVRVLVAADSGNGVGGALDTSTWTFVNPETTVHLRAYPGGEWVGLESSAAVEASGVGLVRTTIHDPEKGPCRRRSADPASREALSRDHRPCRARLGAPGARGKAGSGARSTAVRAPPTGRVLPSCGLDGARSERSTPARSRLDGDPGTRP